MIEKCKCFHVAVAEALLRARQKARRIHYFPDGLYLCLHAISPEQRKDREGNLKQVESAQVLDVVTAAEFFSELGEDEFRIDAEKVVENWNSVNGPASMREHRMPIERRYILCENSWLGLPSAGGGAAGGGIGGFGKGAPSKEYSRLELILSAYGATVERLHSDECAIELEDLSVQLKYKSTSHQGICVGPDLNSEERMHYDRVVFSLDYCSWMALLRSSEFWEAIQHCQTLADAIAQRKNHQKRGLKPAAGDKNQGTY